MFLYCTWSKNVVKSLGIDTSNMPDDEAFVIQYNLEKSEVDVASKKGYSDGKGNIYHLLSQLQ